MMVPPFLRENWVILLPFALGFVAIYLLLPRAGRLRPIWGGILAAVALVLAGDLLIRTEGFTVETLLFYVFAGIAVVGGGMMITQSNPVHAALSFAIVVLSTCGLFLLQAAPFLMAATIIVYAGAIVVTFLFVIMLAQQEGVSNADQRSREPFLATLAGFVLMAAIVCVLHKTYDTSELDQIARELQAIAAAKNEAEIKGLLGDPLKAKEGERTLEVVAKLREQFSDPREDDNIAHLQRAWLLMKVEPLKAKAELLLIAVRAKRSAQGSLALDDVPGKTNTPGKLPAANVAALGRTLYTDYLIAVELAATLLLIATMGAIIIAGRRAGELR